MKGRESGLVRLSELVVRPRLAFRPKASLAFASATSFLVTTPMTCKAQSLRQTPGQKLGPAGSHGSSKGVLWLETAKHKPVQQNSDWQAHVSVLEEGKQASTSTATRDAATRQAFQQRSVLRNSHTSGNSATSESKRKQMQTRQS